MENTELDYLEYQFLTGQFHGLMETLQSCKMQLAQKPGDIDLLSQKEKIEYDMNHIRACVQKVGIKLVEGIELKYNFESKFMLPDGHKRKNRRKALKVEK